MKNEYMNDVYKTNMWIECPKSIGQLMSYVIHRQFSVNLKVYQSYILFQSLNKTYNPYAKPPFLQYFWLAIYTI